MLVMVQTWPWYSSLACRNRTLDASIAASVVAVCSSSCSGQCELVRQMRIWIEEK